MDGSERSGMSRKPLGHAPQRPQRDRIQVAGSAGVLWQFRSGLCDQVERLATSRNRLWQIVNEFGPTAATPALLGEVDGPAGLVDGLDRDLERLTAELNVVATLLDELERLARPS